jgi:hypothetical protein
VADVLILLAAAVLTLGAGVTVALIARAGRRQRQLAARDKPARLQEELDGIDDYIRRLDQAAMDDELTRLERERKRNT